MYTLLLLLVTIAFSDIQRGDDNWFKNEFSLINKGRLYNTLIYLENLGLAECVLECIRFLDCVTVNYHSESKICELADDDFDWYEADVDSPGWYNYGTPPRVDGGFTEWSQHTPCSPPCGSSSKQVQTRSCTNPEPKHGGADCVGEKTRVLPCPCPIDGGFTEWMPPCLTTCGDESQQMQTRTCTNPALQHGGADCVVDGNWGKWNQWSRCSATCGGKKTRTRTCDRPKPHDGGKTCPGSDNELEDCKPKDCSNEAITGRFGAWMNRVSCSPEDCRQKQERTCMNPTPGHGGADCVGEKTRYITCGTPCKMITGEGEELKISCANGMLIKIVYAYYGRWHTLYTKCNSDQSSVIRKTCDGKDSCSKQVNNYVFGGDPCRGIYKYLTVGFKCAKGI